MNKATVTELLEAWKSGDRSVENALAAQVYPVIRDLARSQVRRNSGALTLAATELANEAYERLHRQQHVDWRNRQHFFAIAATVIRRVVIDYLRQRSAEKRGGEVLFIGLDDATGDDLAVADNMVDWLALDAALNELSAVDADCARVVELRLFSGLTVDEIADVAGSSTATVGRQWRFARVWLSERLDPEENPQDG
jgi:RNA polymerase sigma factor (TIGR02999 family)